MIIIIISIAYLIKFRKTTFCFLFDSFYSNMQHYSFILFNFYLFTQNEEKHRLAMKAQKSKKLQAGLAI